MDRRLGKAIDSWLNAERANNASRAELALRRVFLRLPRYAPPPGFVADVLARLGLAPVRLLAPSRMTLRWKAAIGVSFALVALAGGILPRTLGALWAGLGPGKLIDFAAGALVGLSARLAEGMAVWGTLSGVARIVSESLASSSMMAAIAAAALLSAAALRLLHGLLITAERNTGYARPS